MAIFYNTKKQNEDSQSCFALAAHRVVLLNPDVQYYLCHAELNENDQPFACAFKRFVQASDSSGIVKLLRQLLASNNPLLAPGDDGGKIHKHC